MVKKIKIKKENGSKKINGLDSLYIHTIHLYYVNISNPSFCLCGCVAFKYFHSQLTRYVRALPPSVFLSLSSQIVKRDMCVPSLPLRFFLSGHKSNKTLLPIHKQISHIFPASCHKSNNHIESSLPPLHNMKNQNLSENNHYGETHSLLIWIYSSFSFIFISVFILI